MLVQQHQHHAHACGAACACDCCRHACWRWHAAVLVSRGVAQQHRAAGCHQSSEHKLHPAVLLVLVLPVATCLLTCLLLCRCADGIPYGVFGVLQQVWRGIASGADRRDGEEVRGWSSLVAVAKPGPAACPCAAAAARPMCVGAP
jgi:hypothetical protein